MAEKKAFVLRLNPELLKDLEKWAQDELRSLNGQIEFILKQDLIKYKRARECRLCPECQRKVKDVL